ncbi:MAG TPA: hypothetical protein VIK93_00640 [Limnochordales bacterium]
MGIVRTVLGDIDAAELGVTNAHEHLLIRAGVGVMLEPALHLDSVDKACQELELFRKAGGRSIVDMMPVATGRDAAGLVEVARRTGVHVIAASGFHQAKYYTRDHWIYHYTVEQIAQLFIDDIEVGMDRHDYGGPIVERLPARAGVLKAATDQHAILPIYEKLFAAVAMAHRRTGAPISTHTTYGTMALEQVSRLADHGVPADAIIIGHVDRNLDLGYHKAIAATGAFLCYDGPSRVQYYTDEAIARTIAAMFEAGYGDRILLGSDLAKRSSRVSYGGGPGLGYLLNVFVPRLKEQGLDEEAIQQILVRNPARAFALYHTREQAG